MRRDILAADRFTTEWWGDFLLNVPLRLAILAIGALIVRYILLRIIDRMVDRTIRTPPPNEVLGSARAARVVFGSTGGYSERRSLRAQTMGSVFKNIVTFTIGTIAVVMVLDILGYSIGPLLASAGIAGVALGFGAQNLVKDFLAGIAMLLEDQYGVGDVIDMGHATGTVEAVSLRITQLRSVDGTVWYVRNGEVARLGNSSHGWSRAVLDIQVGSDADIAATRRLLGEVAHELVAEDDWSPLILEEPEVWGVEELAPDTVVIRLVVKTKPLEQWGVARELRERIKRRFDEENLELPEPGANSLRISGDDDPADPPSPSPTPPGPIVRPPQDHEG